MPDLFPQCEFHQSRLDKLEEAFQAVSLSTARIEERIAGLDNKMDMVAVHVSESRGRAEALALEAKEVEMRVLSLEEKAQAVQEAKGAVVKWAAGIAAAVIGAILLTFLRLR